MSGALGVSILRNQAALTAGSTSFFPSEKEIHKKRGVNLDSGSGKGEGGLT